MDIDYILKLALKNIINIKNGEKLDYFYAVFDLKEHIGIYRNGGKEMDTDPRYELLILCLHKIYDKRI